MRPQTYLNLAISVDGKITTADRALHGFGGPDDRDLMDELRAQADAVMIGAATLREEDPLLWVRSPERLARRQAEGRPGQPWNVIVSQSLQLGDIEHSKFFQTPGFRRVVVTGENHPVSELARFKPFAEVISLPLMDGGLDLQFATEQLYMMGVRKLLLEGGGTLNFAMMNQGLVDELYLTLCPLVFGGDTAPTAVGGVGFAFDRVPRLDLLETRPGGDGLIFLRYRVRQDSYPCQT